MNRIKVGDVVLVHSDSGKRLNWPLAIVTELKMGKDGIVRSASIKTKHGLSNRPITKLYPLEVCSTMYDKDVTESQESSPNDEVPVRKARKAADRARTRMLEWTKQLLN